MMYKFFPHTEEEVREMLHRIGVKTLDDLYAEVPEELKLHRELDIPQSKSEIEVRRIIRAMADKNRKLVPFAGAGVYDHYVPSMIPYITSRSEFSTSYTPYQAEISQGTLQYIFEYQTMMADLTGMDISNASMYDGSTATAEAMLMCVAAAKKRNKVLISATFNPRVLNVVRTYAKFHGVELVEIPAADGVTDREAITRELAAGDVAGVMVAQPNHYGLIEDFTGLADDEEGIFCPKSVTKGKIIKAIDENGNKRNIILADASPYERSVPCVECTHSRHETDGFVLLFASLYMLEEFLLGGDDLHIS